MAKKIDRTFKRKLERVLSDVNSLNCRINSGGCGFFAFKLYEVLTNMDFNPKLVLVYNSKHSLDKGNEIINSNSSKNKIDVSSLDMLGWTHVMVKVNGYYIDSNGIEKKFDDKGWGGIFGDLSFDILSDMIRPNSGITWNPMFNNNYKRVISRKLNQLAIN